MWRQGSGGPIICYLDTTFSTMVRENIMILQTGATLRVQEEKTFYSGIPEIEPALEPTFK